MTTPEHTTQQNPDKPTTVAGVPIEQSELLSEPRLGGKIGKWLGSVMDRLRRSDKVSDSKQEKIVAAMIAEDGRVETYREGVHEANAILTSGLDIEDDGRAGELVDDTVYYTLKGYLRGDDRDNDDSFPVHSVSSSLEWLRPSRVIDELIEQQAFRVHLDMTYSADEATRAKLAHLGIPGGALKEYDSPAAVEALRQHIPGTAILKAINVLRDHLPHRDDRYHYYYDPQSPLLEDWAYLEGLAKGTSNPDELFSYASVEGAESRHGHPSSARYGEILGGLVRERGADSLMQSVRTACGYAYDLLDRIDVTSSEWTRDGAWAAWDIAKQEYYRLHVEEQMTQIRTPLDFKHYGYQEQSVAGSDAGLRRLGERQAAWEVVQQLEQLEQLRQDVLPVLVAALHDTPELVEKLQLRAAGQEVDFRSSELAAIGEKLNEAWG